MQFLKRIFQFYIFSNIHVAIAVACLVKITLFGAGIFENYTPLFVFFSTIVAYNLIRFFRYSDLPKWVRTWLKGNQKLLIGLTIVSSVAVLYLTFKMQFKALLWLFPFGVFTIFYALPLPFKKGPLRNLPGIKIFLISVAFAGITVLFPLVQNDIVINSNSWVIFIQRFIFIVLITIPFDIRDLNNDMESLKTLPQKFGIVNVKLIGFLLGVLFFSLEFLKASMNTFDVNIVLIISAVSVLFLIFASEKQVKYYSSFWVESIPIYWYLALILFN